MIEGLVNACFVVLDVETTGLSSRHGDKIIEVAAVKCEGLRVTDRFESLVNPQRPLSYGAYQVNRISPEMLKDAPLAADVLPQVFRFMQGSCVVGHNIKFDLGFLRHELSSLGLSLPGDVPSLDTCQMARGLLPGLSGYSLREVAYAVGLESFQQHRAMADVEMTYEVFRALLQTAERHDLFSLPLLMRIFGPSGGRNPLPQDLVPLIQEAIDTSRSLELIYSGITGQGITLRTVTPRQLVRDKQQVSLVAYCHLRQEERRFRLDRILWARNNQ